MCASFPLMVAHRAELYVFDCRRCRLRSSRALRGAVHWKIDEWVQKVGRDQIYLLALIPASAEHVDQGTDALAILNFAADFWVFLYDHR